MCFAPRYISGPIAAPFTDCRNTASLPDTPCAPSSGTSTTASSSSVDAASTKRGTAETAEFAEQEQPSRSRRTRRARRLPCSVNTLVLAMALVARLIDCASRIEQVFRALRLRRLQRRLAPVDHHLREGHPVALIDGAAVRHDHVGRLDQRRGAAADRLPLRVGARRDL